MFLSKKMTLRTRGMCLTRNRKKKITCGRKIWFLGENIVFEQKMFTRTGLIPIFLENKQTNWVFSEKCPSERAKMSILVLPDDL